MSCFVAAFGAYFASSILSGFGVIPATQIIYRNLIVGISMVFILLIQKSSLKILSKREFFTYFSLGILLFIQNLCSYSAMTYNIPVSIAGISNFLQPVFTTILAFFFLKEKISIRHILSIIVALMGGYFVTLAGRDISLEYSTGLIFLITGIMMFSAETIFARFTSLKNFNPMKTVLYSYGMTVPVTILSSMIFGNTYPELFAFTTVTDFNVLTILILFGISGSIALATFYIGSTYIPAQKISMIILIYPVFSFLFGILFLKESYNITFNVVLGILLIIISIVYSNISKQMPDKQNAH